MAISFRFNALYSIKTITLLFKIMLHYVTVESSRISLQAFQTVTLIAIAVIILFTFCVHYSNRMFSNSIA